MTLARNISIQGHVSCLVAYKVLGPEQGSQYSKEYQDYLIHNGPEWTCERYKAIYTSARHLANGNRSMAREVLQSHSIAYHKDTLYPKGASKNVVATFVTSKRPSVKRRYAGLLRSYTDLTLDHGPTKAQSLKAIASIESKSRCEFTSDQMSRLCRGFKDRWESLDSKTRREISKCSQTMAMHSTSYYYYNVPLKEEFIKSLKDRPYGQFMLSMLTESWIPESLEGQSRKDLPRQEQFWEYGVDSGFAGRILGMQQQGCKLRVVAQPTAELQLAFAPLHKSLQNATSAMFPKESCVEYQEKGIRAVLDHLRDGHPVFSVDLSSATDRFPRQYSEKLLDIMGLERYSKALEDVCNRPWENANLQGKNQLYYEVGQPMGLYGSFPLFNLSNLAIADESVRVAEFHKGQSLTPFRDGTYFKVVGDDIVISDSTVAAAYGQVMEKLGCDISPSKSFKGQVAEFAGFIAVPSKDGYTAFRPYKFPTGEWITNPMDYIHAFGVKASKGQISESQKERWDNVFKAYSHTFSTRNLDLTPILWREEPNPIRLVGKEPWLESLVNAISLELTSQVDSRSRTLLCAQEWLNERSGYAFLNETFPSDVVSSLVPQTASRLDDVQFTPEIERRLDKASKAEFKALEDFWKDPLNAEFKDQILNPKRTGDLGGSFKEAIAKATVQAKYLELTRSLREPKKISKGIDIDPR